MEGSHCRRHDPTVAISQLSESTKMAGGDEGMGQAERGLYGIWVLALSPHLEDRCVHTSFWQAGQCPPRGS